jgi:hypothetical protein
MEDILRDIPGVTSPDLQASRVESGAVYCMYWDSGFLA